MYRKLNPSIARTPVSIKKPVPKSDQTPSDDENVINESLNSSMLDASDGVGHSTPCTTKINPITPTLSFVTKRKVILKTVNSTTESDESSKKSVDDVKNVSAPNESVNTTDNASYDKSSFDMTPEMEDIMDNLYGEVWRSTPGLFRKRTKSEKKRLYNANKDIDDDLVNELKSMNINNDLHKQDDSFNELNSKNNTGEGRKDSGGSDSDSPICVRRIGARAHRLVSSSSESSPESDNEVLKPNKLVFSSDSDDEADQKSDADENQVDNEPIDKGDEVKDFDAINKRVTMILTEENDVKHIEPKKTSKINKKLPIINGDRQQLQNRQDGDKYSFIASLGDNIPPEYRDYKAKYYRDNFKSKKQELAVILYKIFNIKIFQSQLPAKFDIKWSTTLRKTAGRAHNKLARTIENGEKKSERKSRVELSVKVVDTAHRLRDTLAHELCHVATWLIDGQQKDGHGPYWKAWTMKILNKYPEIEKLPVCHSLDIHYKYSYRCVKCGYKINRHSKSIDVTKKACGYCYGKLECMINKKNKEGLVVSTPSRTRKEANGFAMYVKDNYGSVRSGFTPHKETMKFLARQYAQAKLTPHNKENLY